MSLPPCSFGVLKSSSDLLRENRVMQFLQGLHDSFSTLRGNILLIGPFPPVNKVYSLVLQEEKQRELNTSHISSSEASALAAKKTGVNHAMSNLQRRTDNSSTNGSRSNKHCCYCKRSGHVIEECYKLHGYPSHKPNMSKSPQRNRANHSASPVMQQDAATPLQDASSLVSEAQRSNMIT